MPIFILSKKDGSIPPAPTNVLSQFKKYALRNDKFDSLQIMGDTNGNTLDGTGDNFIDTIANIKELTLNNISLGPHAINRCPELEKIVFGPSVTVKRDSIFYTPKLTEIEFV